MHYTTACSWLLPLSLNFFVSSASASAVPNSISARGSNSASDRQSWADDFDITTNYYDNVPDTGVTREYWFDVVNTTVAPDGVERVALTVNGTIPGPTIIADWGDTVGTTP